MADLQQIETVLREANRIVSETGNVFVAFYRFSAAQQRFLTSLGLLRDDTLHMRSALVLNRLGFGALVAWVAKWPGSARSKPSRCASAWASDRLDGNAQSPSRCGG